MKSPFWIICSDAPVQLTRSCKHTARQFAARISLERLFRLASDKGDRSRLDRCLPRQAFDKKRIWNHEHAMLDLPTAKSCPVHFAKLNLSKLTHPSLCLLIAFRPQCALCYHQAGSCALFTPVGGMPYFGNRRNCRKFLSFKARSTYLRLQDVSSLRFVLLGFDTSCCIKSSAMSLVILLLDYCSKFYMKLSV